MQPRLESEGITSLADDSSRNVANISEANTSIFSSNHNDGACDKDEDHAFGGMYLPESICR